MLPPIYKNSPREAPSPSSRVFGDQPSERLRVLLVEDDPVMLESTAALLDDYEVLPLRNSLDVVGVLTLQTFDVVCTDLCMPEMDGDAVLVQAHRIDPTLGRVLVTGALELLSEARATANLRYSVLAKPYKPTDLLKAIEREGRMTKMRRAVQRVKRQTKALDMGGEPR